MESDLKVLMDKVFGENCFQRGIIWRMGWLSGYKTTAKNYIRNHDTILYYTKDPKKFIFNKIYKDVRSRRVQGTKGGSIIEENDRNIYK